MTQKFSIFFFAVTALLIATPNLSEAYFTTEQTATKMTNTTALYTISYKFGPFKNDTHLPAATARNLLHDKSDHDLGYTVRDDEGEINNTGDTAAIVFADAKIKNGMYVLPAGKSITFTLVTFFRADEKTQLDDYKVQVEQLPFPTLIDEAVQNRSLNPSELQYYVTPTIELGQ